MLICFIYEGQKEVACLNTSNYQLAVEKYSDMIFRIAYSYCKKREDAEDIVQNTYLKLLNCTNYFENEELLKRWLIRVAINESKNMITSFWKKRIRSLDDGTVDSQIHFDNQNDNTFFEIISKLSGKYKIVTYLYYYEEYSVKEIANILGIKETTVQTRLMRARQKMKQDLLKGGKPE